MLPGFIDPHSHLQGYGFFSDTNYWTDVSSVNLYFKPRPSDARCTTPTDPQLCFIPVQTQDDVTARITSAAANPVLLAVNGVSSSFVFAANYDPARLGHSASCMLIGGVGYQCPNFEDGNARKYLDSISSSIAIFVTSESGHINYANTPALRLLNICGTDGSNPTTV